MNPSQPRNLRSLRLWMLGDAVLLGALGLAMVFRADLVEAALGFRDLPRAVNYTVAMHGCVMLSLAYGYCLAALNPNRSVLWVQMAVVRAVLEVLAGAAFVAYGVVTFRQACPAIGAAAVVAVGYLVLYPRSPMRAVPVTATPGQPN